MVVMIIIIDICFYYVAQTGLKHKFFLSHPLEYWDYLYVPSCLV